MRQSASMKSEKPAPHFEARGPLLLAGLRGVYSHVSRVRIPEQWARLVSQRGAIPQQMSPVTYGAIITEGLAEDAFAYFTGVEVASLETLPPGLEALRLHAPRYAVFRHKGHVSAVAGTMQALEYDPAAGADFVERYGEDFDPISKDGGFDILVPLKR